MPAIASVPTIPVINPYQRHIDALCLADESIDLSKMPSMKIQFHTSIDNLLNHMYATFEAPEFNDENRKLMQTMLDNYRTDGLSAIRQVPPTIVDAVWPVMMMKMLLCDYRLPIDTRHLTTFKEFHKRYDELIISA
jgi:hypothetical protein